jgi:putative transposase
VPRRRRERRERTHEWKEIQQQTLWPEQEAYERLRPIVLFGETAASRAKEIGVSERTLHYQADQFEQYGMVSLFPKDHSPTSAPGGSLPPEMRQFIVDLKAEHGGFRTHEIATICFVRFGRKPSDHTVQRVLADGPRPDVTTRRYPPYAQIADPYQRRRAIVDLHAEGWSNTTISAYLQTPRHRVYEVLKRWATEGHAGLDDRPSSAPHNPARKVTMHSINEVRKLAEDSPELGAYRVRAALEQIGIHLSQATCGRLLALNRNLYGLTPANETTPRERKAMPFKAHFRHEYWSVDVRYIEEHSLGFPEPVYLISVLENYSRAVLASKISRTQNQWDFLEVLFAALSTAGAPNAIVSDGGAIFYCNQAMDVYSALGITKERIEKRQAWQNYIETHFNTVRKMVDAKFARATSWEEMLAIHRTWMRDYNSQRHWAHEAREDGRHSPADVLGWHKGTIYEASVLDRILFATRYTRHLDKNGYLRFQNWMLYGEGGLAHAPVTVWVYDGSLKVEHQAVTLSRYTVELQDDKKHLRKVSNPRLVETPFRSPQLRLFDLGPDEWLLYWRTPEVAPARRRHRVAGLVQPLLFDLSLEMAVGANETGSSISPHGHLQLLPNPTQGHRPES